MRVGDVLTFPLRGQVRVVRVLSLALRRGPATEARMLYDEISKPRSHRLSPRPSIGWFPFKEAVRKCRIRSIPFPRKSLPRAK